MDLLLWPVQETGSRVGRGVQPQRTRSFLRRGASRLLPSSQGSQGAVASSAIYPSGRNHPTEKLAPNQQLLKQDGERREELGQELHPVAGPSVRPGRGSRFGVPGVLRDKRCGEPDRAWRRAPTQEGQPEQGARARRQPSPRPVRSRFHRPALAVSQRGRRTRRRELAQDPERPTRCRPRLAALSAPQAGPRASRKATEGSGFGHKRQAPVRNGRRRTQRRRQHPSRREAGVLIGSRPPHHTEASAGRRHSPQETDRQPPRTARPGRTGRPGRQARGQT